MRVHIRIGFEFCTIRRCSLQELQNQMRYKARLEELGNEKQIGALPPIPFPQAFYKKEKPNSELETIFRVFSNEVMQILNHFRHKKFSSNLTHKQKTRFVPNQEARTIKVYPSMRK
ncbi:hypothetical protein KIN20_034701 [Parelaphostrongylus tenuis]|uniref:Uncharacterized protein n=1 Tax=Parelaphostrongylus tenuis TaxID=148309 RepID=A0AAD5RAM1_PARTN|nr:hypothetical protein KIN20_034701 [Parelaphostrongylus tenuis]